MKNFDEIIKRFDSIEELSVSEEMLGAYLEGKLDGSEFRDVQRCVDYDSSLAGIISDVDNSLHVNDDLTNLFPTYFDDNIDSQMILSFENLPLDVNTESLMLQEETMRDIPVFDLYDGLEDNFDSHIVSHGISDDELNTNPVEDVNCSL